MRRFPERGLYIITDCQRLEFDIMLERTEAMLHAGVAAVQYRDKHTSSSDRIRRAEKLQDLCKPYAVPLIINDDIDVCLAINAEGLHIGGEDIDYRTARNRLPDTAVIGVSCYNSLDRARNAQAQGADYVAFGAFFPTGSKETTVPATTDLLRHGRQELDVPVVAIGGITQDNCRPLLEAGADLLAVINSVYQADNPAAEVGRFNDIIFGD